MQKIFVVEIASSTKPADFESTFLKRQDNFPLFQNNAIVFLSFKSHVENKTPSLMIDMSS